MLFNMIESTGLVHPVMNVVFDDSLYAVDTDKEFVIAIDSGFNYNITFPSYAETIRIEGTPSNFNYPITIPNSVKNISNLFATCGNYNQPITINTNITRCENAFRSAYNFNAEITIVNGVKSVSGLLTCSQPSSSNFNRVVNFPDSLENIASFFYNCAKFNKPVDIPSNVLNMGWLLYHCDRFNSPVNINSNVVTMAKSMFYSCYNYNLPVTLPDSLEDISYMFFGCNNYDQPTVIPNNCVNMYAMFQSAINFNSEIDFSNASPVYMEQLFSGAYAFNRPMNIPAGVTNCQYMFSSCTMYNSVVIIPNTVKNTQYMFSNVNSRQYNYDNSQWYPQTYEALRQPIYFYADNTFSGGAQYMFQSCNTMTDLYLIGLKNNLQLNYFMRNNGINRCNIYTDDISQNILYNTYILTNYGKPTWTRDVDNGCIYNTTVNLYVYNNWDGVIPTI